MYSQTSKVLHDLTSDPDSEDLASIEPDLNAEGPEEEDEGFEDTSEVDDPTLPEVQPVAPSQLGMVTPRKRKQPSSTPPETSPSQSDDEPEEHVSSFLITHSFYYHFNAFDCMK